MNGSATWCTCPLVQNGVLRVASQARYPNVLGTVNAVRERLRAFTSHTNHAFIPDDVSLLDDAITQVERRTPSTVADVYRVLVAQRHGAKLATFDRRIASATCP